MHQQIEEFLTQEEYKPSSLEFTLKELSRLTEIEIPESEFVESFGEEAIANEEI